MPTFLTLPLHHMRRAYQAHSRSVERISTGKQIIRAADDAAGLAVAENLTTRAQGARVAQRNILDGQGALNTADSASGEVTNILKRLRELAIQGASGTLHDDQRAYLEVERSSLTDEIDRIANTTDLFGKTWTNGSNSAIAVQVGAGAGDQLSLSFGDLRSANLGVDSLDFSTAAGAGSALADIDAAIDAVGLQRSSYGASMNRLDSAFRLAEDQEYTHTEAASRIVDIDMAKAVSEMAKTQILMQTSIAALMKVNEVNRAMMAQLLG
jgi:flagellin